MTNIVREGTKQTWKPYGALNRGDMFRIAVTGDIYMRTDFTGLSGVGCVNLISGGGHSYSPDITVYPVTEVAIAKSDAKCDA